MKKQHILYWIYDAKKWLIILFFPIIRAVFFKQDVVTLITSSLRDILIALLLIGYSFVKWKRTSFSFDGGFRYEQGVFIFRKLFVPLEDASSITIERTPLMWLTGGRRIRINTAGVKNKSDATIYAHKSVITGKEIKKSKSDNSFYSAKILPVLNLCISSSNAALGLLTLAPLIRQAGNILGKDITQNVYNLYSTFDKIVSFGLPPFLNNVANVFILGWAFSFITTFSRYARFHAQRTGDRIFITSGLLSRRDIYIESMRVTTLELKQTLFMKVFGLFTVSITAAGYGRERDSKPVVIPAARRRDVEKNLEMLFPNYPSAPCALRPHNKSVMTYIYKPSIVIASAIIPLIFGGVWMILAAIIGLMGLWWLTISLTSFFQGGVGINYNAVSLKYSRGLAFYHVQIPLEVVDSIAVNQSYFQKRKRLCTIKVYCYSEKKKSHTVKALSYDHALHLIDKHYINQTNHVNQK